MARPAKSLSVLPSPSEPQTQDGKPSVSASDIKKLGWRGVLDLARKSEGQLSVTNHDRFEGVIMTREAYDALTRKAREQESVLAKSLQNLSAQFDDRLSSLQGPQGAARLRAAIDSKARLRGKVKAGASH